MCLILPADFSVNRITIKNVMINIVLFGPPGAGKGTQAKMLTEKYSFNHISTGDVIRQEIRRGSALGLKVKEIIECGKLAPDELVIGIIEEYMEQHPSNVGNIFDGFPRTTHQAEAFDAIMKTHGRQVNVMLSLDVPDEMLVERLLLRGECSGRADDSDASVIRNRIDVYKAQTAVVADYYGAQNKYVNINGTGTIDEVFGALCSVIDKEVAKQ